MTIKDYIRAARIARDVRIAQRKFERLRKSSAYERAAALVKRGRVKEIIRAAGYKEIRIKEKAR